MKVTVAANKCQGCGLCEVLAPTVFELQDGLSHVIKAELTEEERVLAAQAARECPTDAIRIEE